MDVLFICEPKIDQTFPSSQFVIPGFTTPYRSDRSVSGGDIMLYIREGIPSRRISSELSVSGGDIMLYIREGIPSRSISSELSVSLECRFVEINLYKNC